MNNKIVDLFPKKPEEQELPLREHFQHFLSTLDNSLNSFSQLNAMEKYSLYKTLVEFSHVSLESYLRLKGE